MKTIVVNNFARGMADDKENGITGEFAIAKHFDVLTNPRRLQPLRGMTTHTANTGIGNMIIGQNGTFYGVGVDYPSNPTNGQLWKLQGLGASDNFIAFTQVQLSGATVNYDLLVEFPNAGNSRTIIWASNNLLVASDPNDVSFTSTQALTFTTIGQGFVHPKDKVLYFPYRTSTASYIATLSNNATPFTGLSTTAFTLPSQYRCYCLTNYGNYLAIPATSVTASADVNSSVVYLSDRDTSQSTFTESIPWGQGSLKVLNNLQGVLVGISELAGNAGNGATQDYNSIQIKVYDGGTEPILIKEIKAFHLAASGTPTATINPRVNFIANNRLYFSINIDPGDSIQPAVYGLWSVGRNKLTGEWTVNQERMATNDGSETSVIAAAMTGDYVEMVHTAVGTLTKSTNGVTSSTTYGATSIYESLVNPSMDETDKLKEKKLHAIACSFLPLPSGASIVFKYRVDSQGADTDWVTVYTYSTTGGTYFETSKPTSGFFTDGRNYEFSIESVGGAVPLAFGYKYDTKTSLI